MGTMTVCGDFVKKIPQSTQRSLKRNLKINMKKIHSTILVLGLLLSGNANATMNEIKKIGLLVEYLSDRSCNVTQENIETTTKYILSNSRLKLSGDNLYEPYLYIQPVIMEGKSEDVCTGALVVFLKKSHNLKDGSYNRGDFKVRKK